MFLVDKQIASTRAECVKGDTCQGRPMVRCPSVLVRFREPFQDSPWDHGKVFFMSPSVFDADKTPLAHSLWMRYTFP